MPLSIPQAEVFTHEARNRVMVCGRRFGKTTLACNELIRAAQMGMDREVWYVCPTYKMAKRIMWKFLMKAIPKEAIKSSNITDLEIVLKGYNSYISLKGCEDADNLRGDGLDFLCVDETQDVILDDIDTVLAPQLADRKGDGLYIGTPKGMGDNAMYQLYMRGLSLNNWNSWQFTSKDGGNVDDEELEALKERMSPTKYRQEMEGSFEAVQGRVFYSFHPLETVRDDIKDTGGQLLVGMDFNVAKMCSAVSVMTGGELHIIDEIMLENSNTREMCNEINKRYPTRDIMCYPDPSANSRKTSAEIGRTDMTIIKEFGFGIIAPRKAPLIVDSVNDVNAMLLNANGVRRLFVHPKCRHVIACLDGLLYKEGTSQPDKTSGLDHMADAIRYIVSNEFSLIKREVKILTLDWTY